MAGDVLENEVRSLMRPGVVTIGDDSSVEQARRAMLAHRVHAVLVIGREGRPRGWITAGVVLAHLQRSPDLTPLSQAALEPAVRVEPSDSGRRAADLLAEHRVSRLLVARSEDDHPEGVIGELDLLGA
jgi:CBS domain-containing protein